ncbi:hypothetical protein CBR_g54894 [Chara braunii]|uniref:Reverse transcriptase RNase H-like domain-containing protein n=1 Tax=Chara braunii TaxID=69332 RepID=A0A388JPS2_CHABU|nr:hypothetical protein CBR_g54894 [Chara braunii]|eukprot:GBG59790.1 hypothetical protein CBR_g54894 [Chara braunii]
MVTLVKENRERKELLKQAKLKAIAEEQAARMKKLEEEMEEKKKVDEEEAAAEEAEERRHREAKGESSGTTNEDAEMQKKISEWIANLSLGEDEEAQLYVPQEEKEAFARALATIEEPLERQETEEEKKLEWKLRMNREKKRRREEVNQLTTEVEKWRRARALKAVMDDLVAVPDHGVTQSQLVQLFYRAMPEPLRGHFFDKSQQPTMTYDALSREVVLFEAKSMPVSTFWHKDLDKGKKWKGHTISGQVRAKDHMILTLEEGGTDEVPYSQIEWGLEEEDSGMGQGRSYAAVAAGGRPQSRGGQGQRGQAMGGRGSGAQGVGGQRDRQEGGRGQGPPRNRQGPSRSPQRRGGGSPQRRGGWHPANYYRKFVRNFSTIAAPLCRLLKKEAIWQWDKDCTSALKKLKRALIEYHVLKVEDPSLPFVVTTVASQYGIGVVLQQDDDNGYRPVEFMSATMPSQKVATSTYERELYALRQALEHWKHYLLGRHFKVYSDHETLKWLKTQAKMTPKLTRWAAEIDQYDLELKPLKGKHNAVADALSRTSNYFGAIVHYLDIGSDLQEKVRQAYAQDPVYSDLLKKVKEAPETKPDYRTTEGLLFEKTNVAHRLCIPNSEEICSLILGECHDTEGHLVGKRL